MSEPRDEPDPDDEPSEDPRLFEAVQAYMDDVAAGRAPSRKDLLARHPDIADELSACLRGLHFLNGAVGQLNASGAGGASPPTAPHGPTKTATADSAGARTLGDFRLVREIGRGGMGVVYEAVQLSLGRRVAVKVLPTAAALDARQLQRFRNEAQAAAQLHHTNIVPVYAVGCERSVHFYAMQLIEGQSLADVVRELRVGAGDAKQTPPSRRRSAPAGPEPAAAGSESTRLLRPAPAVPDEASGPARPAKKVNRVEALLAPPSNNLTTLYESKRAEFFRTAARLGVQAADALEHAHNLGVVHRDVKPANLLIDARGTLWVTDFGLAQFYDANEANTNLTQTGDLLGTLRYMSPEQASGRRAVLDARTDVYSLGVTLYELVTLHRAVGGETRHELLRQIDAVDPPPPRSIDRSVPPELQTILAKATAKDAADRYATARALADDLRRYLSDQPIVARPPSAWDVAVKWTRRHRVLAAAAVVVLLVVAAASTLSAVLIAREQRKTQDAYVREQAEARLARQSERAARLNEAEAQVQRERAQSGLRQARQAIDVLAQVAADELPHDQASTAARRHLLEESIRYYQHLIDARGEGVDAAELAAARERASALLAQLAATSRMARVKFELRLLQQPPVRDDLDLTAEQVAQIAAIVRSVPGGDLLGRPGPPADAGNADAAGLDARAGQADAAISAALTAAQRARLQQISRQTRGVAALDDPDVVAALKLTDAQQQMVRRTRAEWVRAGGGPFGRPGPPGRPADDRPDPSDGPPGQDGSDGPPPRDDDGTGPPPPEAFDDAPEAAAPRPRRDAPPPASVRPVAPNRPGRPGGRGPRPDPHGGDAAAINAIMRQLDPPQVKTWESLIGPPFDRPISLLRRPGDPPPQD